MNNFQKFSKNLLLMFLIVVGAVCVMAVFFPGALQIFSGVGMVYGGLGLWPFIIILILLAALPRRRNR